MSNPTRKSLFEQAAKKMSSDFEEIRKSVPHGGEGGQEAEEVVKKFLGEYLPKRYSTTSGFIIDNDSKISSQQDVIIYDAFNCPVYRPGKRGMIVPNDNVASTIEVTYTLTTQKLSESLKKIHKQKQMTKTPSTSTGLELSHTYAGIFAFESKVSIDKVLEIWEKEIKTDKTSIFNSCGIITILNEGVYTTALHIPGEGIAPSDLGGAPPAPPGTKAGITFLDSKGKTLDLMMRLLIGHLTFFWHRIDHPGFNFSEFGSSKVRWLTEVGKKTEK